MRLEEQETIIRFDKAEPTGEHYKLYIIICDVIIKIAYNVYEYHKKPLRYRHERIFVKGVGGCPNVSINPNTSGRL